MPCPEPSRELLINVARTSLRTKVRLEASVVSHLLFPVPAAKHMLNCICFMCLLSTFSVPSVPLSLSLFTPCSACVCVAPNALSSILGLSSSLSHPLFLFLDVLVQVDQELADSLTESVVDGILCIRQPKKEQIDIHMVEIMTMQHKSAMDTKLIKGAQLGHNQCSSLSFLFSLPPTAELL